MGLQTLLLFSSGVLSFLAVYFLMPLLIEVAGTKNLFDLPDGERKFHSRHIPSLGGIGIFVAFICGFSISGYAAQMSGYPFIMAALTMLFFTGLKDDLMRLSPAKKLIIQLFASVVVVLGGGLMIDNFYGLFGIGQLPVWVSVPPTIFTFIVVMNAYNLIDGIDGLAGGVGIFASLFFGAGFYVAGEMPMAVFCLMMAVVLSAFLIHNFRPATIFMGDSGSLMIGFALAFMAIRYVGLGGNSAFTDVFGNTSTVLPVVFLIIPLYDTLRVFSGRIRQKQSPFDPGTDHIHHVLLKSGFSHGTAALYLYGAMILIAVFSKSIIYFGAGAQPVLLGTCCLMLLLFPTQGTKRLFLTKTGLREKLEKEVPSNNLFIPPDEETFYVPENKEREEVLQ